jgi:hypothetical protein
VLSSTIPFDCDTPGLIVDVAVCCDVIVSSTTNTDKITTEFITNSSKSHTSHYIHYSYENTLFRNSYWWALNVRSDRIVSSHIHRKVFFT